MEQNFATVVYYDRAGVQVSLETAMKMMKIAIKRSAGSVSNEVPIPPHLKKLADEKKLTREALLKVEYTDLLRLATYPPATDFIAKEFRVRGLPIKGGFTLMPHQIKAIEWMRAREAADPFSMYGIRGGIISLKMGLGKSLTALAHILTTSRGEFPSLIVGSKTVVNEWKTQGVEKFFGTNVSALYVHKDYIDKNIEKLTREIIKKYDVVITTYDVLKSVCRKYAYHEECQEMGDEHTLMKGKVVTIHPRTRRQADQPHLVGPRVLYGTPWRAVICDESQVFANPKTFTFKSVMALYGDNKWLLTGTPIRNYDTDIWAQLRFLGYNGITTAIEWKRKGTAVFQSQNLKSVIFTMDYEDAGVKLPPKHELIVPIKLEGKNRQVYDYMLGETRNIYDQMMARLADFSCVLVMFLRLRQTAIAPYLLTAESKREKPGRKTGKALEAEKRAIALLAKMKDTELGAWCHDKMGEAGIRSPKMLKMIDVVKKLPPGEKILIFSSFAAAIDLAVDALQEFLPSIKYVQIDGSVTGQERYDTLEQFRSDPETRVFFGTYKCCSEGLNLTEANHVICLEEWWTSTCKQQSKARSWRTGQKRAVYCHNFLSVGSIEEKMLSICKEKEEMANSYLEGTERPMGKGEGLDKFTLGRILGIYN